MKQSRKDAIAKLTVNIERLKVNLCITFLEAKMCSTILLLKTGYMQAIF